ncbi:MAG: TetR/AcrR family transcriptional regulator [Gammaproteobacteria bacterium]
MAAAGTATVAAKGRGRLKREATEAALVEAFGRVVQRNGLRSVGVNEVIKEAGIGKSLLYRYFGGLPGLVRAWGEQRVIWPDLSEFHDMPDDPGIDARVLLKRMVRHHADALREDPLRAEIIAEQFMNPTPISPALQEIRVQLGDEHRSIFQRHSALHRHSDLMRILMGAVSFLAMRAVKAPWYMGENIGADDRWARLMDQVEAIVDAVVPE